MESESGAAPSLPGWEIWIIFSPRAGKLGISFPWTGLTLWVMGSQASLPGPVSITFFLFVCF